MKEQIDIQRLNALLRPLDDQLTERFECPEMPVVFILSQPRAGSTLLVQLLLSALRIGYVSNIQAKFWEAPYMGAMIAAELWDDSFVSSFQSSYGNSDAPLEPHEWGWFWRKRLGLEGEQHYVSKESDLDIPGLLRKLAAMEAALRAPLLFDNIFGAVNLGILAEHLPVLLAVHLRRDPFYVCNSLINARLSRHGDIAVHYGNHPRNMDEIDRLDDPIERIVAQVRETEDEFQSILSRLPSGNVLAVDYEDMTAAPMMAPERFAEFMARNGVDIERREIQFGCELKNRNNPGLVNPDYAGRLEKHFETYFPSEPV